MNKPPPPYTVFADRLEYIGTFFGYDVWHDTHIHGTLIPWLCQPLGKPYAFWVTGTDWLRDHSRAKIPRELFDHLHAMSQLL